MRIGELLDLKSSNGAVTISPDSKVLDAAKILNDNRIGFVACCTDDGALSGVFSERDLVRAIAENPDGAARQPVSDFMTADVATCAPEDEVKDIMQAMGGHGFRHMPVMIDGKVTGVISIKDIFRHYLSEASPAERMDVLMAFAQGAVAAPGT